jgi:F-type H+-transporting ATPase subunit b
MTLFLAETPLDSLHDIGVQTGFDMPHFLSQAVAFLIFAAILTKFAYQPVRKVLEERRAAIETSLANAEKIKKQLADAEAKRLEIIQKANQQAEGIVAKAEQAAAVITERRAQEATAQAEDIVRKAREAAALERERMLAELKREVGALVIQTTEKVAGKVLTADDQTRLNAETLAQLDAAKN